MKKIDRCTDASITKTRINGSCTDAGEGGLVMDCLRNYPTLSERFTSFNPHRYLLPPRNEPYDVLSVCKIFWKWWGG